MTKIEEDSQAIESKLSEMKEENRLKNISIREQHLDFICEKQEEMQTQIQNVQNEFKKKIEEQHLIISQMRDQMDNLIRQQEEFTKFLL